MKSGLFAALGAATLLFTHPVYASPENEHGRALTELAVLGETPTAEDFVRAGASRHRPLAQFFLGATVDVNATTEGERTARLTAATHGDAPLVARLLAIYFACWAGNPVCTQALLKNALSRDRLRIEISLNQQQTTFDKSGEAELETSSSTGRAGFATKPGASMVTDKHRDHTSSIYQEAKMPFFMRLNCKDFGLHEGRVTGRPASHGGVRLPGKVARRIFAEVPTGMWVSIK